MSFFQSLFGTAEKKYQDIPADEFLKLSENTKDVVLLDVRTPAEFAGGKLKGAINIDIFARDFQSKIAKLDKDKTYLVYCRSGNRSGQACNTMAGLGFTKLYNLAGGVISM
ncbi:rhodanese-like domain-containing protein [Haliscomenobacter hydrossis]|uniref:Rhodanese-like protein n=1 Tax=Haliscomenobacter hydrossis (strain ATCC 27775 / DSM 1100 / LMG 10767 / O) TaxID=760192 RepID=F4KYK3_HALH1|nr:rhodanese-like domain-containing protein [Haliscomenobacter hydrossis]AEE50409.1 Rhodanese-like protein [Haliscomenobacter hydrossis DSM 1100]